MEPMHAPEAPKTPPHKESPAPKPAAKKDTATSSAQENPTQTGGKTSRETLQEIADGKIIDMISAEQAAKQTQDTKNTPEKDPASDNSSETKTETPQETSSSESDTPAQESAEPTPDKEKMTTILTEANELLLELRDMRLVVNAIATQAADTPLGNEVRMDALRTIAEMDSAGMPPDAAATLNNLKARITDLHLPEKNPAESATVDVLNRFNEAHPDKAVPQDVIENVRSGKKDGAETVAQMLQTNNDLAQMTWQELTGVEGFTKLTVTPDIMLDLAGINKTPENQKKAREVFGIVEQQMKDPGAWKETAIAGFMYTALAIQVFSQIALGEGGHGGH